MSKIGLTIAGIAFKTTLELIIKELLRRSSNFKKLSNLNVDNAYLKAKEVEKVKTIWQFEKPVNLNDFYYPSKVKINNRLTEVKSINTLGETAKVVIQGTAGQGKSILLRYLAGKAIESGSRIPIFIELRKISAKNTIEKLIELALKDLGLDIEKPYINEALRCGKFTLLLDAFDEIEDVQIKDTLTYVENQLIPISELGVIITSRPDSEIQKIFNLSVYKLEELTEKDFLPLLKKLFIKDDVLIQEILKAISESSTEIRNLLKTPLMLTLLVITYRSYSRIPDQLHIFYDSLFNLLATRHDETKPGFTRKYYSQINKDDLEKLFCAFCFSSMLLAPQKNSLTPSAITPILTKAKSLVKVESVSISSFLKDCTKNTCLILKDGVEYHFIHKSIKEFHAAKFIVGIPETLKREFYSNAIDNYVRFRQELNFLSVMDEYYYNIYYFLPIIDLLFKELGWSGNDFNKDISLNCLCNISINNPKSVVTIRKMYPQTKLLLSPISIRLSEIIERFCIKEAFRFSFEGDLDADGIISLLNLRDVANEKIFEYLKQLQAKYNEVNKSIENQSLNIIDMFQN